MQKRCTVRSGPYCDFTQSDQLNANSMGEYVEKMLLRPWCFLLLFDGVILASATYVASYKAQFIAECNKCAGLVQKIAPKNNLSMVIHTQLGTPNRPGRGWFRSVQSHFPPPTDYYLVVRERFLLHTTAKIAERLLQSSSVENEARFDAAENQHFATKTTSIACSCRFSLHRTNA